MAKWPAPTSHQDDDDTGHAGYCHVRVRSTAVGERRVAGRQDGRAVPWSGYRAVQADPETRQKLAERFSTQPDEVILVEPLYVGPFKNPQILVEACGELGRATCPLPSLGGRRRQHAPGSLDPLSEKLGHRDHIVWLGNVVDPRTLLAGFCWRGVWTGSRRAWPAECRSSVAEVGRSAKSLERVRTHVVVASP
jgi:hypothetical protein